MKLLQNIEQLLIVFHNNNRYLIFYCPLNLFYKCVAFMPVKLVLVGLKEVVRTRKIAAGVHHAHHAYHHGWFIMVIIGYVKGGYLSFSKASSVRLLAPPGGGRTSTRRKSTRTPWPLAYWSKI